MISWLPSLVYQYSEGPLKSVEDYIFKGKTIDVN